MPRGTCWKSLRRASLNVNTLPAFGSMANSPSLRFKEIVVTSVRLKPAK